MRGPERLRDLPRPAAWALVGAGSAGLVGAIAGLIRSTREAPPWDAGVARLMR